MSSSEAESSLTEKQHIINIMPPHANISENLKKNENAEGKADMDTNKGESFDFEPWAGLWDDDPSDHGLLKYEPDDEFEVPIYDENNKVIPTLKELGGLSKSDMIIAAQNNAKEKIKLNRWGTPRQLRPIPLAPAPIPLEIIPITVKKEKLYQDNDSTPLTEFQFFPYLPTKIRYRILQYAANFWQEPHTFRMQYSVSIDFDVDVRGTPKADWEFNLGPKKNRISVKVPLLHMCQESRIWIMAEGWEMVPTRQSSEAPHEDVVAERRLFNFETGKMIWDTNGQKIKKELRMKRAPQPLHLPLSWRSEILDKVRRLAIDQALWFDWRFGPKKDYEIPDEDLHKVGGWSNHRTWKGAVMGMNRLTSLQIIMGRTGSTNYSSPKLREMLAMDFSSHGIGHIPLGCEVEVVNVKDLNF